MFNKKNLIFCIGLLSLTVSLFPSRNPSRYFPFLERTEEYITKQKSHVYPSLFMATASTAFKSGGGNLGIPELWGRYNLKQVIYGVTQVKDAQGMSGYNPFVNEIGYGDWNEKNIRFRVNGKVKSRGVALNFIHHVKKWHSSFGFNVPFMHVNTSLRYVLDKENSDGPIRSASQEEMDMINRVRNQVHCDLGLKGTNWGRTGFGDLDLFYQYERSWDHMFKMKNIDLTVRTGVLVPTGEKKDYDYPSSIPFMGNGHWANYLDIVGELELKQDWKFGMMLGFMYEWKNTEVRRFSHCGEPMIFGAICGKASVDPGVTFKIAPYFTLENLQDGLHVQGKYTYRRHASDEWEDKRSCKDVSSYLTRCDHCVLSPKRKLSRWTSQYITLQVVYDSVEAMKNWWLKPKFYASLDYAMSGKNICKTHQFTVGVQLHPW